MNTIAPHSFCLVNNNKIHVILGKQYMYKGYIHSVNEIVSHTHVEISHVGKLPNSSETIGLSWKDMTVHIDELSYIPKP